MLERGRRTFSGFGWFTTGTSVTPRARTHGRKLSPTPKRYPKLRPFTEREQLVIAQLRAARLAKTLVA